MKHVLITGGSSGIGLELVRIFYKDGFKVSFTYRSGQKAANELIDELSAEPQQPNTIKPEAFFWDAADKKSLDELFNQITAPVDILINNAGLGTATVKKITTDEYEQDRLLMQVNAVSPLWLIRKVLPAMKERSGTIVNVSSVGGGITQFPNFTTADGMSKSAVAFMTRQLAAEFSFDPVNVFAVCPGAVETPMFGASTLDHLSADDRKNLINRLPGQRLIEPSEIAVIIRWLCRPEAVSMRGAVIDASLGLGSNPGALFTK
ncbi:MAG: SDR family NAD(P)-dependent oxidoreductase [Balneolales bacterium]|nr:SDR family NAD(P)-dependent oxidoreductase [Balneolales bacterium]